MRRYQMHSVYTGMLKNAPHLPADLLRTMWSYAKADNDQNVAEQLARRLDAPEDLVAAMAADTTDCVRTAFMTRPDAVSYVHSKQTPATLAASLKLRPDAPDVVKRVSAEFNRRPTQLLAEALVSRSARLLDVDTLTNAAALLATTRTSKTVTPHLLANLAYLGPDRANRVLSVATNLHVVNELLQYAVDLTTAHPAAERALLDVLSQVPEKESKTGEWYDNRGVPVLLRICRTLPKHAALGSRITEMLEGHAEEASGTRWRLMRDLGKVSTYKHNVRERAWKLRPDASAPTTPTEACGDGDELHASVEQVLRTGDKVALVPLMLNPTLAPEDRTALLDRYLHGQPEQDVIATIASVHGTAENMALLREVTPAPLFRAGGWDMFGGRAHAPQWLSLWVSAGRTGALRAALAAPFEPAWWEWIPVTLVLDAESAATGSATALAAYLDQQLGQAAAAWEIFASLSPEFTGTYGELMATCKAVIS